MPMFENNPCPNCKKSLCLLSCDSTKTNVTFKPKTVVGCGLVWAQPRFFCPHCHAELRILSSNALLGLYTSFILYWVATLVRLLFEFEPIALLIFLLSFAFFGWGWFSDPFKIKKLSPNDSDPTNSAHH